MLMNLLLMNLMATLVLAQGFDHSHVKWSQWLKKFATVDGSVTRVDYAQAFKDSSPLDAYLKEIDGVTSAQYNGFSDKEKLAFLINTYNALTVKWILLNYPVKSIKKTASLFASPWKKKFFRLFGEEQNLDGIEHETIRKQFNEPRIHFAVNCASKGCPALRGEAFVAAKLEEQLDSSSNTFLKDPGRNRYDNLEKKFYLSKIFGWYGDDFKKKFGSVQAFVSHPMAKSSSEEATMKEADISFNDYDWTLNEK